MEKTLKKSAPKRRSRSSPLKGKETRSSGYFDGTLREVTGGLKSAKQAKASNKFGETCSNGREEKATGGNSAKEEGLMTEP